MDAMWFVGILLSVVGLCFSVIGFLIKIAMDRNTEEIKGLRSDVSRLFEKSDMNAQNIIDVKGDIRVVNNDIRTINERCRLNHGGIHG